MSYKFQGSLVPVYILDAYGSIEFREGSFESKSYFKMKIVSGVAVNPEILHHPDSHWCIGNESIRSIRPGRDKDRAASSNEPHWFFHSVNQLMSCKPRCSLGPICAH